MCTLIIPNIMPTFFIWNAEKCQLLRPGHPLERELYLNIKSSLIYYLKNKIFSLGAFLYFGDRNKSNEARLSNVREGF